MLTTDCEVVFRPPSADLRFLPEGPYDLGDGRVSWVAIQHGADAEQGSLNILDLNSQENQSFLLPGRPGFAFPSADATHFTIGLERQLVQFTVATGACESITSAPIEEGVEGTIINDGEFFAEGMLFGCKDLKFQENKAGLYLWRNADATLHRLRSDQICSNGKVIVGANGNYQVYDIDSPTKQVVQYELDVAAATLQRQRVVVDVTDGGVFPDGMVASPDGRSLIIAYYNPEDADYGEARQHSIETGKVERVWRVPGSPQVTCPQIVHVNGKDVLFLTTAVEHMSDERQLIHHAAGCLFVGEL